ncbi:MAG: NusG domain II-containing protein [Clostridiales bacterium]|nr:NusG domain II-containing protein [Clostridiales bacterium]
MLKKKFFWIGFFTAIVIAGIFLHLKLNNGENAKYASIYQDGVLLERIDLNAVVLAYTKKIEFSGGGYNIIEVSPGGIEVIEADCPDQICVSRGRVTKSGLPIVCMPHRLMIEIEGEHYD